METSYRKRCTITNRKIRPLTGILYKPHNGIDKFIILYYCPNCHKQIHNGYKSESMCNECGVLYDWGAKEPIIEYDAIGVKWWNNKLKKYCNEDAEEE